MANKFIATKYNIVAYLREKNIFAPCLDLIVENLREIKQSAEGYVNPIYRIRANDGSSVVLKQVTVIPITREEEEKAGRTAGNTHDLDAARMRYETAVLIFWNAICEGITPEIYLLDEENCIIVMEDLTDLSLLRFDFARMAKHPQMPEKMGKFFARNLFYSSDLNLTKYRKDGLMKYFNNPEYRALEPHLFETCCIISDERPMPKKTWPMRKTLIENAAVQKRIAGLRYAFTEFPECIIHTDLHASNVMVDETKVKIIDTEFAGFGPIAQDIGRFTASFVLNFFSWYGDDCIHTEQEKADYRDCLLQAIIQIYCSFEMELRKLIADHLDENYNLKRLDVDDYIKRHIDDALAYTALNACSRIADRGLCHDLQRLQLTQRIYPQLLVLQCAKDVLSGDVTFGCIFEFTDYLSGLAAAHPYDSFPKA